MGYVSEITLILSLVMVVDKIILVMTQLGQKY